MNRESICDKCISDYICLKPWESDKDTQIKYLGRTFTKEEWIENNSCPFYRDDATESKES